MSLKPVKPRIAMAGSRLASAPTPSAMRMTDRKLLDRRLRVWATDPHCAHCGTLTAYPDGFELDHRSASTMGRRTRTRTRRSCASRAMRTGARSAAMTTRRGRTRDTGAVRNGAAHSQAIPLSCVVGAVSGRRGVGRAKDWRNSGLRQGSAMGQALPPKPLTRVQSPLPLHIKESPNADYWSGRFASDEALRWLGTACSDQLSSLGRMRDSPYSSRWPYWIRSSSAKISRWKIRAASASSWKL